jgi:LPXTG-motif cell wall-anchored protein
MIIGLAAALAAGLTGLVLASAPSASAETAPVCTIPSGWYANADEQDLLPEPTEHGLKFEGKDLIHHTTDPIDLADMDKVIGTFHASVAGKVVFKVETSNPYSSIITQADGKLWSTAMDATQEGGQSHPVDKYSDLVGKPTKVGKPALTSATRVVTFGVGYWTETGSTVVDWIAFHGTKYDLKCLCVKPTPSSPSPSSPSPSRSSASPTPSPSVSMGGSTSPNASPSRSIGLPTRTIFAGQVGDSLPKTGFPVMAVVLIAVGLIFTGLFLLLLARRRSATS